MGDKLRLSLSSLPADLRAGRPLGADGQPGGADEAAQRHHWLRLLTVKHPPPPTPDPSAPFTSAAPAPPRPPSESRDVAWFPHSESQNRHTLPVVGVAAFFQLLLLASSSIIWIRQEERNIRTHAWTLQNRGGRCIFIRSSN